MHKTGHLGNRELFALVLIVGMANNFLTYPQQLILLGGSAGWMIPLLSMGIALLIWRVIVPTLKQKKGILQRAHSRASRYVLAAFALIASVVLLLETASTMRLFTETVVTTVMPRSPIAYIALPLLVVMTYYAYVGIEAMSRVSWLLLPLLLGGLLALLALNMNWMSPEYLFPFLGRGIPDLLISSGTMTGLFENILLLTLLAPFLRKPEDAGKIGYWSILCIGLSYSLVTLVFILVFSADGAMRAPFPLYQLGRLIYVGRFIQRLEASFVFIWVAVALIKMSFHIWLCAYLTAVLCKMPINRPLVFPLSLIAYSLSFAAGSFVEMLDWSTKYLMYWDWTVFILLPLGVMLFVTRSERREEKDETAKTA